MAGGGTEAWSRIAACKMCHNTVMCDPWWPQNHPTAHTAPVRPCLIPPLTTFGPDFPILVFPYASSCVSPFLPILKKSWTCGCGIFNRFCGFQQQNLSFGCRDSTYQQRREASGPQAPVRESLFWSSHTVILCLDSTLWSQRILGFFGKQLDKQSFS